MNQERLFDLTLATTGLVVTVPLLALISAGIAIEDGCPILFRQTRLGREKRPFRVYKFRTMRGGEITIIGRWLRETGLDELPQIINVIKGEMSVVGPRPLNQVDVERLGWHRVIAQFRWQIAPGITGLAQLYSGDGAADSLCRDAQYLQHQSLVLDGKIVLLSFLVNVFGKRRVRQMLRAGPGH